MFLSFAYVNLFFVLLLNFFISNTRGENALASPASRSPGGVPGSVSLRHSFNSPFTDGYIIFWEYGAGAVLNQSLVRITPARQSRTGFIWNNQPSTMVDWQVDVEMQVTGQQRLGGDGFAFWYSTQRATVGTVYGSTDYFNGLAIVFDSFNNDNLGQSPLITAQYNDGTQKFDQSSDGASQALSSCSVNFRNTPSRFAFRIIYQKNKLQLFTSLGAESDGLYQFRPCFTIDMLVLGVDKYFGLTAHTGEVADNHDVFSFIVTDLSPSNSDLEGVRSRYTASVTASQSTPSHMEMSSSAFQHSVLTTLSQVQAELNLMQVSHLALTEYLHANLDDVASAANQLSLTPASSSSSSPLSSSSPSGGIEVKLDSASTAKLNSLIDSTQQMLREIRLIQQTVESTMRAGVGAGAGLAALNNIDDKYKGLLGGASGASSLSQQKAISSLSDSVSTLTRSLSSLSLLVSSVQAEAARVNVRSTSGLTTTEWIMLIIATVSSVTLAAISIKLNQANAARSKYY